MSDAADTNDGGSSCKRKTPPREEADKKAEAPTEVEEKETKADEKKAEDETAKVVAEMENAEEEEKKKEKESAKAAPEKENAEPESLPMRPIKKARTAYFIFADEKRPELQANNPGEPVGIIARLTGQMWSTLTEQDRVPYQQQSAAEREKVALLLAKYKDSMPAEAAVADPHALVLPVARIRKISKLDPDVKGISKEAAILITKCAELAMIKLGQESVKVAQLQNRRKLLPEDIAQVCSSRESFLFLREDVKDLLREQVNEKKDAKKANPTTAAAAADSKPLTSYFGVKS